MEEKPVTKKIDTHDILIEQGGIRTYQKDQGVALSGEQGALVKETILKEREKEQLITSQTLNLIKNKVFFVLSFILFFGSIGIIFYSYTEYKKNDFVEIKTKEDISIISFSEKVLSPSLPLTKEALAKHTKDNYDKLKDEENYTLGFLFDDKFGKNKDGIALLSILNEKQKMTWNALNIGKFDIGLLSNNKNISKFIIIETDGSDGVYRTFGSWEETIAKDLKSIFDIEETVLDDKNIKWEDSLYENIDFRKYTDVEGKTLIIKGFLDSKTFIITDKEESLGYILSLIRLEHGRALVE